MNFSLKMNERLLTLNLSRNNFKVIDSSSMMNLQTLFNRSKYPQTSYMANDTLVVDMTNNALSCSCIDYSYLTWIHKHHHFFNTRKPKCGMGLEWEILDKPRLQGNIRWCERAAVLTCYFIVLAILVLLILAEAREINRQSRLEHMYRSIAEQEKYVVYVYFDNDDIQIVTELVLEPLQRHLEQRCNTDMPLVAANDPSRAGSSILVEIQTFVRQSVIVLVVLSSNVIGNDMDTMHVESFIADGKPVIAMVLNAVDENSLGRLESLYSRYMHINVRTTMVVDSEEHRVFMRNLLSAIENKMIRKDRK